MRYISKQKPKVCANLLRPGKVETLLSETADVALIRQPNGYNGRLIEMDWMAFFVCENRVDLIRLAEPVRWGQIG